MKKSARKYLRARCWDNDSKICAAVLFALIQSLYRQIVINAYVKNDEQKVD